MREQNHQPHVDGGEGGQGGDDLKDVVRDERVEGGANDEDDEEDDHGHDRHAARLLRHDLRGEVLASQPGEHVARAEEIGVDGGDRRGDDHDVEGGRRPGHAQGGEDLDEGAFRTRDAAPRIDHEDDQDGQHVKQEDAHRDGVDGLGHGLLWVFGLCARHAHDFGAAESEEDQDEGRHHAGGAIGEESAVVDQIGRPGGLRGGEAED